MRRSLWILPALLLFAIRTTNAPADVTITYGITFDGAGAPTVVGPKLISYDTVAGCFTAPASLVLLYRGTQYTLPLADPKEQKPTDPTKDKYEWGASQNPDGPPEIFVIDLTKTRNIYIYNGGASDRIPSGIGAVMLIQGGESHHPSPTIASWTSGAGANRTISHFRDHTFSTRTGIERAISTAAIPVEY